jgi:polar amino acid transport system ATP-binding protein
MRDYAIEINNLNKHYGENHVLRGIDVSISPGEVICVIGGSGSGKSTLLRCINFLEDYSSGSIVVNGENVGYEPLGGEKRRRLSDKENRQALRDVCMVFQQFNLWPHMTVLDNVATPLRRVKKVSREAAYAEAKTQLARVGLADKADSWPAMLSGGQQQRVAIARALTMKPAIMLFDEPTSA